MSPKPRVRSGAMPILISLDRRSTHTLQRQIYGAIRDAILTLRLAPGSRLPPTRNLADELRVSRSTVVGAFEQLETEGYITGRRSAGSFVAILPLSQMPPRQRRAAALSPAEEKRIRGAASVAAVLNGVEPVKPSPVAFRIGEPALDLFPSRLWARLQARRAVAAKAPLLGYGDGTGHRRLRSAIAAYVSSARSVVTNADQVIITRGTQQSALLAARLLLSAGDQAWVEDPGYLTTQVVLQSCGATVVPIPVDEEGMVVAEGIRRAPRARMAYVSPSHQFPLGSTMSLKRRLTLLDWAHRNDAWIFEDDYDSEFRYTGSPIASLQGIGTTHRVIYGGTFSKSMFPALRIGYLVVPDALVEGIRALQSASDHMAATIEQATLADFIEEGHFSRHVRTMRLAYASRQQALLRAIAREAPDDLVAVPTQTGMHVVAWLKNRSLSDRAVSQRARALGVEASPLSRYALEAEVPPGLVLGFAAIRPSEMTAALRLLRDAIRG